MKDFPVFTTEYGVASLILREIPYRQEAYILLQATGQPEELLQECVSFCRVCGAEKIYARGHEFLERYPLHTIIYEMSSETWVDETKVEHLWPVTEQNVASWRKRMNERLAGVDNAATLDARSEKDILSSNGAYFVHHGEEVLGGFWVSGEELLLVAAFQPGAGERVMHTMMSMLPPMRLKLDVVSTNHRAIRFYEKLGFIRTGEKHRWYKVL